MNDEYWRYGLQLESAGLVKGLFKKIHKIELNSTRAKQIVAAYLQGKEYYRNAQLSDMAVKPLLLFYGVSSLSRSLTLLLQRSGGEETLANSHGLSASGWNTILNTDIGESLKNIGNITVTSTKGLFGQLLEAIENKVYLHTRSTATDWTLKYDKPEQPIEISFSEILERMPDLKSEYELWSQKSSLTLRVNDIKKTATGFTIKTPAQSNVNSIMDYDPKEVEIKTNDAQHVLNISEDAIPFFINSFIEKMFGKIPNLHISKRFNNSIWLGQIPMTFILSYYLGMLCRYFPTHWMSLSRGNIGDEIWPLMQVSMNYIDVAYPQLIMEFIEESSKE